MYVRKRIGSRLSSTYVDVYSDTLYQLLLRNARDAKAYRKNIRRLDKELAQLGYTDQEISPRVQLNLDFARANMKSNIYDQAILEGVATSFPQTEDIIDNGIVNGMTATDVQKILNLKHAWEDRKDAGYGGGQCDGHASLVGGIFGTGDLVFSVAGGEDPAAGGILER